MCDQEAKCPRCLKWSTINEEEYVIHGTWWWFENYTYCPKCGIGSLMESITELRDIPEDGQTIEFRQLKEENRKYRKALERVKLGYDIIFSDSIARTSHNLVVGYFQGIAISALN